MELTARKLTMRKIAKKSLKSRLVKKWLEHESSKNYEKALGTRQRGKGIYVLYKSDKLYYVGVSRKSLRSRIRKHLRDRHRGKWDNFSFYQILKEKYLKDIESLLLRYYKPLGNRVRGKFKRKYGL